MMRSMFSSISALRAHQTRMDVIGDNIANVNTVGFKSSRATFASVFASVLKSASAPNTASGRGGSNPMQIGLGVSIASVDMNMTRGNLQRTDDPTDLAIEGDGFFVVGGDGKAPRYTRAGNFSLDKMGNLVTATGLNVLGWMYDPVNNQIDTTKSPSKINILAFPTLPPMATDKISFDGNLSADLKTYSGQITKYEDLLNVPADSKYSMSFKIYDSQGKEHTFQLTFVKTGDNTWNWYVDAPRIRKNVGTAQNPDEKYVYVDEMLDANNDYDNFIATGTIIFGQAGKVFDDENTSDKVEGITITGGRIINTADGTFTIKFKNDVVNPITFKVNSAEFDVSDNTNYAFFLKNITQFGNMESSIRVAQMTGYSAGNLQGFNVDASGKITGVYSNGLNQLIGQIAVATFANPAGLQRIGDNLYINTVNSGDPEIGTAGSGSRGTISQGTLEMSNVDLAKEFTDMIVTQRGYQANARVITSSDEILQELVNIKR
uniref:Flagellar hook protein FlgE n=1 Tax=Caldicellulosiruptor owensensis TaxID=55205 RepID=A0A7C5Z993_9FIRM